MSKTLHFLKKLYKTICITANLAMARTFGKYVYSGWDGDTAYARYTWRGKDWKITTSAYSE